MTVVFRAGAAIACAAFLAALAFPRVEVAPRREEADYTG